VLKAVDFLHPGAELEQIPPGILPRSQFWVDQAGVRQDPGKSPSFVDIKILAKGNSFKCGPDF